MEEELRHALRDIGLDFRPDSGLHAAYVKGDQKTLTLMHVVNKSAVQHYLHAYTNYSTILSSMYATSKGRKSKQELISAAKRQALDEKPIPSIWPWLEKKPDNDGFTLVTR